VKTSKKRLENKVCIVTGSAGGIGKGIAELLAAEGAQVIIADIQEEQGKETAKIITSRGDNALFRKLDVANEDSWKIVVEDALKNFQRLDVLVNNAGIAFSKMILDMTVQEWRKVMAVNLESVFLGIKHAVPAMKKNRESSVRSSIYRQTMFLFPVKGRPLIAPAKAASVPLQKWRP
jgi:NAD(P)-dependent dehydrogenase (short-subunit alcohol dehydrogenase family)